MKNRTSIVIFSILGMGLFASDSAWAQQTQTQPTQSMPATQSTTATPPVAASPSATTPGNNSGANSATYNTAQGQVTVNSTVPPAQSTGSPPPFEQLAGSKKYITKDDANAYPPLANDFLYASNNGNRISKAQYEHWLKNLQ